MPFKFFGLKSSSSKTEDKKKNEEGRVNQAQPKKLSFEEALARQIQSKAEQVAITNSLATDIGAPLKNEIVFEKAPKIDVEMATNALTTIGPLTNDAPVDVHQPESENLETSKSIQHISTPPITSALDEAPPITQSIDAQQQVTKLQESSIPITREDVIAAYKIFLDRLPESEEVITPRIGIARERLLSSFMTSKYFLSRPKNIQLLLLTAIQIEQKVSI